ncbi:MAG: 50S ribosomal protein L22 [Bacteroidetes bacterium]|nr:50S ribosomal protein L22 [Bacteroidota bacterium]
MEAVAKLINNPRTNNNAGSPRKARYVVDLIRGLDIDKALNVLRFTQKEAAAPVEKVLRSAIKNWEQKFEMDAADSNLYVKECFVDGGKTMRRFQPAPHGRAYRIRKRTNHITIKVASRTATDNASKETKE